MGWAFNSNVLLEKIYISDLWSMESVTSSRFMFNNTPNLTGEVEDHYTMKPHASEIEALNMIQNMTVGEELKIEETKITYSDLSFKVVDSEDVIWFSSDDTVVKANGKGTTTITVKSGIAEIYYEITAQ